MENLLNLQLFVDDEVDTGSEADQGTEQETDQEQEIPAELAGIDKETAREIMKEMQPDGTAEEETEEETSEEESTEPPADADSDNKTVDEVLDEPTKAIPYKRFKEVNDKAKAKDQEIEQLKQQLAAMQNGQQPTAPAQQQVQQPAIKQPNINAELAVQVDALAYQEALRMTGLTKEEVEVLEYAEAGDPKVQAWNASLSFAKNRAWSAVNEELKNVQIRQMQQVQIVQASNQEYMKFEQEQAAQADFPKVRDHAIGEFFNSLSPLDQQAVQAAWSRVEAKQCSPQDVFLIKQYFEKASTDYRSKNPLPVKQDKIKNTTEKLKQMGKHPKVSQVEGSPSSANGLTVDKLEQMVNEKNWDDIPEDIQKVILNGGTF